MRGSVSGAVAERDGLHPPSVGETGGLASERRPGAWGRGAGGGGGRLEHGTGSGAWGTLVSWPGRQASAGRVLVVRVPPTAFGGCPGDSPGAPTAKAGYSSRLPVWYRAAFPCT